MHVCMYSCMYVCICRAEQQNPEGRERERRPANAQRAKAVSAREHHRCLDGLLAQLTFEGQVDFGKLGSHHLLYQRHLHLGTTLPSLVLCTGERSAMKSKNRGKSAK